MEFYFRKRYILLIRDYEKMKSYTELYHYLLKPSNNKQQTKELWANVLNVVLNVFKANKTTSDFDQHDRKVKPSPGWDPGTFGTPDPRDLQYLRIP